MYLTSAQVKGKINSLAKQNSSDPIGLLRIYMMERFLERLSLAKYKDSLNYETLKNAFIKTCLKRNISLLQILPMIKTSK